MEIKLKKEKRKCPQITDANYYTKSDKSYNVNNFVIVHYNEQYYPRKIISIKEKSDGTLYGYYMAKKVIIVCDQKNLTY